MKKLTLSTDIFEDNKRDEKIHSKNKRTIKSGKENLMVCFLLNAAMQVINKKVPDEKNKKKFFGTKKISVYCFDTTSDVRKIVENKIAFQFLNLIISFIIYY